MENKYKKENYQQPDPDINSVFWEHNITTVLLNQYKPYMIGNIADFGCNNGLCVAKTSRFDLVNKIVGFDLNKDAIDLAISTLVPQTPETKHKIEFKISYLDNIEWENEYFDFGYSFHTLEHIYPEDVDNVIKEFSRVLKPQSYMLINMPDKHSCPWEKNHVYHPDLNELNELFLKHNYSVIESYEDERGGQTGVSRNITGLYKKN